MEERAKFRKRSPRILTAYPPETIGSFLELSEGQWLTLRSLMDSDDFSVTDATASLESWHESERGELNLTFLGATTTEGVGELEIALPDQSTLRLTFLEDGTVSINGTKGSWHLGDDGSLELEVRNETTIVKERIWFSKPNLRLRCTLEQFLDGRPGRASFSSEIRRVSRPAEGKPDTPQ